MFETSSGARARWRALVAAGAGASALACASPPVVERGDGAARSVETVTASPELAGWVQMAVERWSAATGRSWRYDGATSADLGATFHVAPGEPPAGYVAFAYGNGRVVVSPEWMESSLIGTVLMHELGHAFRGDHHEGGGVMYYALGDGVMTSCLTPADLVWACRDFDCTDFASECEQPVVAQTARAELGHCRSSAHRMNVPTAPESHSGSGWLASVNVHPH